MLIINWYYRQEIFAVTNVTTAIARGSFKVTDYFRKQMAEVRFSAASSARRQGAVV
jgi:hypothetical protein